MSKITVYSTAVCPYCHMAKDYLKEKGAAFEDIDVGADSALAEAMVQKSGQMGVPVIEIDDKIIVGFNRAEIDKALNLKS